MNQYLEQVIDLLKSMGNSQLISAMKTVHPVFKENMQPIEKAV